MRHLQLTPGHKAAQRGVVGAVRVACRSLCPRSGLRRSLEDQVCHCCMPYHIMVWDSPVNDNQTVQCKCALVAMAAPGTHVQAAHHLPSGVLCLLQQLGHARRLFVYFILAPAVSLLHVPLKPHIWCLPVQVLPGTPVYAPSMQRSSLCRRTI